MNNHRLTKSYQVRALPFPLRNPLSGKLGSEIDYWFFRYQHLFDNKDDKQKLYHAIVARAGK